MKKAFKEARIYWTGKISNGAYLWRLDQYGCHIDLDKKEEFERMEKVSRYMNSFIEIHLNCTPGKAEIDGHHREIERLSAINGLRHLKAAVAVYLCTDLNGQPRWTQRLDLMGLEKRAALQELFSQVLGAG